MRILALDLGKANTAACVYEAESGDHEHRRVPTSAAALHDLIVETGAERVAIEIGPLAGWVADLVRSLGVELQVANVAHEAWRWRKVKRKTDRMDALKLARLSAMNQLGLVHVPERSVRQWRSLIAHRAQLVSRRVQVKNTIRAILDREGRSLPGGAKGWSDRSLVELNKLAAPLADCGAEELWRGELWLELRALASVLELLADLESKLDALANADEGCRRLMTVPGVGRRLAETIAATLDRPERFKNAKQVGAYVGLTPRQYQSGSSDRQGRISRQGSGRLRALLVEVSWVGIRHNPWIRSVYEQVRRGTEARKKVAVVAVARRLLIRCWAMLRDKTEWRTSSPPAGMCAGR